MTMGCLMGKRNQYLHLIKVLYCKLPTIGMQLPAFPHKGPQGWEASVLLLHHLDPSVSIIYQRYVNVSSDSFNLYPCDTS